MPWAELADARLYYEVVGQGHCVLMIPGLGSTCRSWDPIAGPLAEHFSLIFPDNRGIGRSTAKKPARSISDVSSDFVELLDTLQVDSAHVIGVSFGGVLAQRFAVDHPDRVDKLVLISCAHRFGPYLNQVARILAHALRRFPFKVFLETMGLLGTAPEIFDAQSGNHGPTGLPPGVSRKAIIQQLRCLAAASIDPADYVIPAPTLVVAGEFDALIPNCYARQMSEAIPNSRFVVLRGCGHNPVMERPDQLAPLLKDFLLGSSQKAESGSQFAALAG